MSSSWPIFDAQVDPARVAIASDRGPLTYGELGRGIAAVQAWLETRPPGGVLISCETGLGFVLATVATWSRGRTVILPPNLRPGVLHQLHARDDVAAWLHDGTDEDGCDVTRLPPIEAQLRIDPLPDEQVLARLHTSGTTGDERPIDKTAGQLLSEASMWVRTLGLGPEHRVLATVPPHHIYGLLFSILLPLRCGGSLVSERVLHAEAVAELVRRHAPTVLVTTPAHLRALAGLDRAQLDGVQRIVSSGAPLPEALADRLHARWGLPITEVFGSTETGGIASRIVPGSGPGPVAWTTLPGVDIESSEAGALRVRSPFLPGGPEAFFDCADRIEPVPGGFVHLGRADDVVKVAGKRVRLSEMERRLLAIDQVSDGAILAEPGDPARGVRLAAAVVASGLGAEQVRRELARWFDPALVPRRIRMLDRLPRESTGKLSRRRLQRLLLDPDATASVHLRLGPIRQEGDAVTRNAVVPPNCALFEGHFPGTPVLAGVAELSELVLPTVAAAWPELGSVRGMSRLKFRRPIGPGDELELILRRGRPDRVSFEIRRGQQSCASGNLSFSVESPT